MSAIVISGNTSGSVTLDAPAVAGSTTYTLAAVSGTIAPLVSGTAQASTSGTSIDFTGIPSWVKRITIMLNGVSLSGTASILVQIGSTTITTTGYISGSTSVSNNTANSTGGSTSVIGFISNTGTAANLNSGTFNIVNISGNTWLSTHALSTTAGSNNSTSGAGSVTIGGVLDRVRITSTNGTDTFDAGSINIMYE